MSFVSFVSSVSMPIKRIALFDVDGTLIVSKSGRRWAANKDDWIFLGSNVPATLDSYLKEGWYVALVSNQSDWTKSEEPKEKIQSILDALYAANGWKPHCLVATALAKTKNDGYRKPARGLYDVLLHSLNVSADQVEELIMVGDACGNDDPCPAYRWADSDKQFASNIGAKFLRPCEVFEACPEIVPSSKREIAILVGNPGSGKSTTARSLSSYVHVEQDTLKNKSETLKTVKGLLKSDTRSILVDATHGSSDNRSPYIALAKEHNITCRILWHIRDGRPFNALREKPIPEIAYAVYSKYFVDPRESDIPVEIRY